MSSIFKKTYKKDISIPGTPVYTGKERIKATEISMLSYDKTTCKEEKVKDFKALDNIPSKKVTWVSVVGLVNIKTIVEIGKKLNVHDMIIEDILDVYQDQKVDFFDDYDFYVLKTPGLEDDEIEEVSIIKKGNLVVTFFDKEIEIFKSLESRIIDGRGKIRQMDSDYLIYSIFDILTDGYFSKLDGATENIEEVESKILENPENDILKEIYNLREDIQNLRGSNRKIISILAKYDREYPKILREKYEIYYKDLFDHNNMIKENLEDMRENIKGLIELNMSLISHKMNQIMQTLTVISTIFIPLGFLAGLYGMNFQYMPELQFKYSYHILLGVMLCIVIGMLAYFKKKKWF